MEDKLMRQWYVLVVEDDPYAYQIVSYLLKAFQISSERAESAEAALQQIETRQYDFCLIDLALPGMDGWALLKRLKNQEKTMTLPCVAMTAYFDATVEQAALNSGFVGCFAKPLDRSFGLALRQLLVG
jgi:CheY-like chemotaxis protein